MPEYRSALVFRNSRVRIGRHIHGHREDAVAALGQDFSKRTGKGELLIIVEKHLRKADEPRA